MKVKAGALPVSQTDIVRISESISTQYLFWTRQKNLPACGATRYVVSSAYSGMLPPLVPASPLLDYSFNRITQITGW